MLTYRALAGHDVFLWIYHQSECSRYSMEPEHFRLWKGGHLIPPKPQPALFDFRENAFIIPLGGSRTSALRRWERSKGMRRGQGWIMRAQLVGKSTSTTLFAVWSTCNHGFCHQFEDVDLIHCIFSWLQILVISQFYTFVSKFLLELKPQCFKVSCTA